MNSDVASICPRAPARHDTAAGAARLFGADQHVLSEKPLVERPTQSVSAALITTANLLGCRAAYTADYPFAALRKLFSITVRMNFPVRLSIEANTRVSGHS